ncbi:MAG: DUF523 domain-containing protein [Candidatus Aminicenantes bacterium]|nr:DUF523 domain-containing protein [Candidatus Aminicenantes bacterium]NIM82961.1 DUF523 domain-containing protein [Candidatus Aminicenantes bacterium]NIN22338.1 DUF523 domain-containing protein [Candidatus Aminicenantes bacterium]NIN46106.1 DUF523 domain-containing protein [Candidatus Aminicenantes bacterium]NIN88942.1 DUF523 domain-containing protein [Candidatus Aminicenantes bacterium]
MGEKIKLGISSCLLGEKVRCNGGHTLDRFLADVLGQYVDYIPVCPEKEAGFGVPREPVRLVNSAGLEDPRMITKETGIDLTRRMQVWIESRLKQLEKEELCGFIFKSQSPSCGVNGLEVYYESGVVQKNGIGIFACAFMKRFPLIPVVEEKDLRDEVLREDFIARVVSCYLNLKGEMNEYRTQENG